MTGVDIKVKGSGYTAAPTVTIDAPPNNNVVYAGLIGNGGNLIGLFRSTKQGDTWTSMKLPTDANGSPIFTGQGNIHFSLLADPDDPTLVYVGGALWPSEATTGAWSGVHLRGVFNADNNQTTWTGLDGGNPASTPKSPLNAVHADSRNMVFAGGSILEVNDGGIYKLSNPKGPVDGANGTAPTWSSVNGNLSVIEFASIAYDSVNNILFGGAQDNGTPQQNNPGDFTWTDLTLGDGTDTQVDNTSTPGKSIHYSEAQELGSFYRRTYNNANNLVGSQLLGLNVTNGQVKSVTIKPGDGGSGYTSTTTVIFSDPTGAGGRRASGTAVVDSNGVVTGVRMDNPGSGYTTPPTVSFFDPNRQGGTQATGTAVLDGTPLRDLGTPPFFTPYVLNAVAPKQMLLGTTTLYESFDQGDTLNTVKNMSNIGTISALAYGGRLDGVPNPGVAYVGTGDWFFGPPNATGKLFLRTSADGTFEQKMNYPGSAPTSIALDPNNWKVAYIVDSQGSVWQTTDGGDNFTNITGNLGTVLTSLNVGPMRFGSVTLFTDPTKSKTVVFVGGPGGVYETSNPGLNAQWVRFDAPQVANRTLPDVMVTSVRYDPTTNVLVAGTFGRGAWTVPDLSNAVGRPAPQVGNVPATSSFNQGRGPVLLAPNLTVTDAAVATLSSAQITITNNPDGQSEVLAANTTGTNITASYVVKGTIGVPGGTIGVLTLTGTDTLAHYQQVLRTVTYNDTAASINRDRRRITFVVNDGGVNSDSVSSLITINPLPTPGVSLAGTAPDATAVFNQAAGPVVLAPAAVITDPNSSTLSSAQVTITNLLDVGSEVLTADTTGTAITASYDPSTGVLTLSGTDTLAHYQQVLRTVTYSDSRPGAAGDERDVTVEVNDGSRRSAAQLVSVEVVPVNNAPVLDATGKFQLPAIALNDFNNQGSQVFELLASAGPGTITDVDPNALGGMAVVGADNSHGAWQWSDDNGDTWQNFGNPSVTNATLLADDFGVRVRFVPVAGFSGTATLQFRAWDQTSGEPGIIMPESTGQFADTSMNGGHTAFSSAIGTVAVTVNVPVSPPPSPSSPPSPPPGSPPSSPPGSPPPSLLQAILGLYVAEVEKDIGFGDPRAVQQAIDFNARFTVLFGINLAPVIERIADANVASALGGGNA